MASPHWMILEYLTSWGYAVQHIVRAILNRHIPRETWTYCGSVPGLAMRTTNLAITQGSAVIENR